MVGSGMHSYLKVRAVVGFGLINLMLFHSAVTVELAHLLGRVLCQIFNFIHIYFILSTKSIFHNFLFIYLFTFINFIY